MTGPDGDFRDGLKRYQQIAAVLTSAVREGQPAPGERLPSERDLAEEFGASRLTLRKAVIALEIAGLIEAKQGLGVFVLKHLPPARPAPELDIGPLELTEAKRAALLSAMAAQAKDALGVEALDVLADRGYFSGEEILRDREPRLASVVHGHSQKRSASRSMFCDAPSSWTFRGPSSRRSQPSSAARRPEARCAMSGRFPLARVI